MTVESKIQELEAKLAILEAQQLKTHQSTNSEKKPVKPNENGLKNDSDKRTDPPLNKRVPPGAKVTSITYHGKNAKVIEEFLMGPQDNPENFYDNEK